MSEQPATQGPAASPRTSGLAIASFVVSLLFFIPIFGPLVAILLGILALVSISSSKEAIGGRKFAIAGIVIGSVMFLATCVVVPLIIVYAKLGPVRTAISEAQAEMARANLRQIGLGVLMYEADYGDALPPDFQTLHDEGYVKDPMVFGAPPWNIPVAGNIDATSHFYYFEIRKAEGKATAYPPDAPIAWEKAPIGPGGKIAVLQAGGSADLITAAQLKDLVATYRDLYVKEPTLPPPALPASGEEPSAPRGEARSLDTESTV